MTHYTANIDTEDTDANEIIDAASPVLDPSEESNDSPPASSQYIVGIKDSGATYDGGMSFRTTANTVGCFQPKHMRLSFPATPEH